MHPLTNSQKILLHAIEQLQERNRQTPTVKELAEELGVSAPSVHEGLNRLASLGMIRKEPRKARSIEVLNPRKKRKSSLTSIPILRQVSESSSLLSEENIEGDLLLPSSIVDGDCFAFRMQGESMIRAETSEGDYLIVHQQPMAESGEVIVAILNGLTLVRRLKIEQGVVSLCPENTKDNRLKVLIDDRFRVIGKVVHTCAVSKR